MFRLRRPTRRALQGFPSAAASSVEMGLAALILGTDGDTNGFGASNVLGGATDYAKMNLSVSHANRVFYVNSLHPITLAFQSDAVMGTALGDYFHFFQVNSGGPLLATGSSIIDKIGYRKRTYLPGQALSFQNIGTDKWAPLNPNGVLTIGSIKPVPVTISANPQVLDTFMLPGMRQGSMVKLLAWVYGAGSGTQALTFGLRQTVNQTDVAANSPIFTATNNRGMQEIGFKVLIQEPDIRNHAITNLVRSANARTGATLAGQGSNGIGDDVVYTDTPIEYELYCTGTPASHQYLGCHIEVYL